MKELVKSFGRTFGSTVLPMVLGIGGGCLIGSGMVYIANKFGATAAIVTLFSILFLYMWVLNAISDYRLNKVKEKLDREFEEFKSKLDNLK
jgi:Ca2+/Na+ antiporter